MSDKRQQPLDRSAFSGISPIKRKKSMPTDETSIIGGDPDSFITRSFFNTSMAPQQSAAAAAAEKELMASHASMELKLLETQSRIRSLSQEAQKKKEVDAELARERVRAAKAERAREEERGRAAQLETLNRLLSEDLEAERSRKPASADAAGLREALAGRERQVARLEQQLASAAAVSEHSQHALKNVVELQQHWAAQGGGAGAGEAHALRVELEARGHELAAARARAAALEGAAAECEALRGRLREAEVVAARRGQAEAGERNTLRVQEENTALKGKLLRLQGVAERLARAEAELEQANATLGRWKVAVSAEYPSLEHVQDAMGTLRAQVNTLRVEKAALGEAGEAAAAAARQLEAAAKAAARGRAAAEERCAQQRAATARAEAEVALLRQAAEASAAVLASFNREGASFGNYDAAKSQRVAQLEQQLAAQDALLQRVKGEAAQLGAALEATRDCVFALEGRLTAGEFDPERVQVLRLRMNPLAMADEREQRIAQLAGENEALKRRAAAARHESGGGASSADAEALKKDNVNLAKRLERLKEIAQSKITEFREVVGLLFGFRVDVEFDRHIYTLTPIADANKKLKFKRAEKGLQLLETEYALQLPPSATQYLEDHDSIPAFLGHITVAALEQ